MALERFQSLLYPALSPSKFSLQVGHWGLQKTTKINLYHRHRNMLITTFVIKLISQVLCIQICVLCINLWGNAPKRKLLSLNVVFFFSAYETCKRRKPSLILNVKKQNKAGLCSALFLRHDTSVADILVLLQSVAFSNSVQCGVPV